jgi:hypothetical protein
MTTLLSLWGLVFVSRVILFGIFSWDFVYSSLNLTLVFVSGTLVGLIIRTLIVRRKSVELAPETLSIPIQE